MLLLMPAPPAPEVQSRLTLNVRRSEYGVRSSSGQPFTPTYRSPRQSGSVQHAQLRKIPLERVVRQLSSTLEEARAENVSLSNQTLITSFDLLKNFEEKLAPLAPHAPHITFSSDAEIVLEWRHDVKRLIFYIQDGSTSFLKSWGSDIYQEMEEGEIVSFQEVATLWRWLQNQK